MHRRTIFAAAASLALALPAFAQTYPSKPIRLIVPFAPGGTTDVVARVVAEPLSRVLGQSVVVENRGGGGGIIGATETARAAPDGYSIGIATVSTVATNPAVNPKISYNPLTDFTPVINIAATPSVIAVTSGFPGKDWKSLVAELKRSPGKYSYASSGTGGIQHLMMEMMKGLTGTDMAHIPYRGAGPALSDTVAGQVEMTLDQLPSALPFIRNNRLIPVVVAAPKRLSFMPNVPTFAEVGLPQMNRMAFYGVVGPKGMPREIVTKLNAALVTVLSDPAVRKRIEDTGSLVVANSPEEFAAQIKDEFEVYRAVVQKQKLTLD
jgi:tripartite-type tricarboxylate transporter receptor subunit TctC